MVHWARDAAEANRIIAGIVTGHGAKEVVKIKSLTTDEIGLNEALSRAGVEAIETDLAELIIQLAGERSSHILVPAIHKNRAEIRELFRRRLENTEGLTDEPSALAAAARAHLRQKFLERASGHQRGQLRRRRDRHHLHRRVRRQRPDVPDPAEGSRSR